MKYLVVSAAVLIAAALTWAFLRDGELVTSSQQSRVSSRRQPPVAPAAAPVTTQPRGPVTASVSDSPVRVWTSRNPRPNDERSEPELLAGMRSGDASALAALRAIQRHCQLAPESQEDAVASVKENLIGRARDSAIEENLNYFRDCKRFRSLGSEVHTEILLRSAELGDAYALWEYTSETPRQLSGPTAVEEFNLYRSAARRLLAKSMAAGDGDALYAIGKAYREGTAYPVDPIAASAYLLAFADTGRGGGVPSSLIAQRLMQGMTEEQRRAVINMKDQIWSNFRCTNCRGPNSRSRVSPLA